MTCLRARVTRLALLVLFVGLAVPAWGQERKPGPLGSPAGPYREQEFLVPWDGRDGRVFLAHAKIFRPDGEERRPLVLIAHGAPPGGEAARQRMSPSWADVPARWFAAQGFVVVVPMRRGYGTSDGPVGEGSGPCTDPDFYNAGFGTAADTAGVLRHMANEPYVDSQRTILVGYSAGGWGSLAVASRNPPGLVAVISFAGGRAGPGGIASCMPERLVEAASRYGATARVPSLWLYAANDMFFAPAMARDLFNAYAAGGAPAEFKAMPPSGSEGHFLFFAQSGGQHPWAPVVTEFLRAQKLMK
jgi:dienelactone hydrolase